MKQASVAEFFAGRDIFITGGTGFLGKVLIEKLLRTCPDVNRIYVLVRVKKGINPQERITKILSGPLYELVSNQNPKSFEKVVAISGDVALPKLDLNTKDIERMSNVSIIFHSAACVRFNDPLKDAIQMNTRGTLEIMKLAENLQNIKAVIHVSTTFCNPNQNIVEEKLYPPIVDWKKAIKMSETFTEDDLNIFFQKFSENQPNTYVFTKGLAEQVVNEYKNKLPVVVFRPSIVVSTYKEPFPGWIDNFNGPIGLFVASGTGFLRTIKGDPDLVSDHVPVDAVVAALVTVAYKKGMGLEQESKLDELPIYNCALSALFPFSNKTLTVLAKDLIKIHPMEKSLWVAGNGPTKCRYNNFIRVIIFHIFIGSILDLILRLVKKKPFFLKLHRKIFEANEALYYFQTNYWEFKNEKLLALDKCLLPQDKPIFGMEPYLQFDLRNFFENALIGSKLYLLGEPKVSTKGAHIRYKLLTILHNTIKISFYGYIIVLCRRFILSWI